MSLNAHHESGRTFIITVHLNKNKCSRLRAFPRRPTDSKVTARALTHTTKTNYPKKMSEIHDVCGPFYCFSDSLFITSLI